MKTNSYTKGDKGKADRLFSQIIRSQGKCENCEAREYSKLQTAHILSRRYAKTRCDTRNAFCLCASCHFYFTANPYEFARFIDESWARYHYEDIKAKAFDTLSKVDWLERIEFLTAITDGKISLIEARGLER